MCRVLAETAEIGMSPVDSATARDVPHTRLRAIVATPSGSTADQASPRRQRQHFRVRDPLQKFGRKDSLPKTGHCAPNGLSRSRQTNYRDRPLRQQAATDRFFLPAEQFQVDTASISAAAEPRWPLL